jgi:hypothetical protein
MKTHFYNFMRAGSLRQAPCFAECDALDIVLPLHVYGYPNSVQV